MYKAYYDKLSAAADMIGKGEYGKNDMMEEEKEDPTSFMSRRPKKEKKQQENPQKDLFDFMANMMAEMREEAK